MPTGYTAAVQDGTITELSDFAMQCARAFVARITMRDDPKGAEIPERFEPSDYHARSLTEAEADLARLKSMTADQIAVAALDAHRAATKLWQELDQRRAEEKARYEAMLDKVEAWTPPTAEHAELKKFMTDQLSESIRFDCSPEGGPPVRPTSSEWYAEAVRKAEWQVNYHKAEHRKAVERADSHTKWVADLRASL